MKICYVTLPNYPTLTSGRGQDRYAYELIKNTAGLPKTDVVTLAARANKANYLAKEFETVSRLRGVRADVYHATSEYGLRSILVTRKKPTVVTVHDLAPYLFLKHSPLVYANQLLQLSLVRLADRIIVHSEFYREQLARTHRIPIERIDIAYYGVDHNVFRRTPNRTKNGRLKILFLGGLNQLKGIRDVIEAFSVYSKSSDALLLIAGKGKHSSELKEFASGTEANEHITFLGFVDETLLPELYNSVDVVVWPSRIGFGLPILEAMACGTPVIAADCLDSKEYLGSGGISYSAGNTTSLVEKLECVLESENSWSHWSDRAFGWSEKFSWHQMALQISESYNRIATVSKRV